MTDLSRFLMQCERDLSKASAQLVKGKVKGHD